LDSYTLYFFIQIIGGKIMRIDGQWIFRRDCDDYACSLEKLSILDDQSSNDFPYGRWTRGGLVTEV
jgi:hypothetical protein